mgnify:CR=1 FL=1
MRVRDLDTKGNTLAAAFTLSHGNCTSYSEVWNQNNQLDYFTRVTKKKQVFFLIFCSFCIPGAVGLVQDTKK